MSHEDHLHQETKMLTVRDHCTLLTRQFLLKCEATDHPNHASTRDQPVGRIKQVRTDLRNEKPHIGHLTHLVASGKTSEALATLHTETVSNALAAAKINVVLGGFSRLFKKTIFT